MLVDNSSRQQALSLWLDVLAIVERETDRLFKRIVFLVAFKRACIEQAIAYPFLDPFAAEFEYRDGQIRYEGSATAAELNEGLGKCLATALSSLAQEPHGVLLVPHLRIALSDMRASRAAELRDARLVETLPGLFGA
jgi:hypothetical protein